MSRRSWRASMPSKKILSIITVTLNRRATLRTLIDSLSDLTRDYSDQCEHLVIDGSRCEDAEIDLCAIGYSDIRSTRPSGSRRFLKEEDSGLYYAMEKGVAASLGRYIWFLNDDDYLERVDMAALIKFLVESNPVVLVGTIIYRETINGSIMERKFYPQSLSYEELILDGSLRRLPHPATIVKKTEWPRFDYSYSMIADYVALATVLKRCERTSVFHSLEVVMVRGEEQLSKKNRLQRDQEADTFHQSLLGYHRKPLRYRIRLSIWAIKSWRAVLKKEIVLLLGRVAMHIK